MTSVAFFKCNRSLRRRIHSLASPESDSTSKVIRAAARCHKNNISGLTDTSSQHTRQLLFSPLQLLKWPSSCCIPWDFVSVSNKCPSFTVGRLIYSNYKSLCSRGDDRIVRDESIKSLLSFSDSYRKVSQCDRERGVRTGRQRYHTHILLYADTWNIT